ncbi:hypothetical protein BDZ85DRAFT_102571 [Elsinoe ampelina]|uniref:NACHT domain-containing protein n=1 Tax=Elsinoe ampelina TaxID=302913 RepID=A0A6A6GFR5_9PEZI|nr:hypothetical protein BDZ85DRAFT_102571 [Elsinoe ampelina]
MSTPICQPIHDYTVGWIVALDLELVAAQSMLDEEHDEPEGFIKQHDDVNIYSWGRVAKHNVVIASLPSGRYGLVAATTAILHMKRSLSYLRFCLLVGIAAGLPQLDHGNDIRLGDVVVSVPSGTSPGVIEYDFGKLESNDKFQRLGSLSNPPDILLNAVSCLKARYRRKGSMVQQTIQEMLQRNPRLSEPDEDGSASYTYQGVEKDKLYGLGSQHTQKLWSTDENDDPCADCDPNDIIHRRRRTSNAPAIFLGTIASANTVVKDSIKRQEIIERLDQNCLCLEMEAAGVMKVDRLPCLVVRGICDYADAHKNDIWKPYAAATAAAYARELLHAVTGKEVEASATIAEIDRSAHQKLNRVESSISRMEPFLQTVNYHQQMAELPKASGAAFDSYANKHLEMCEDGTRTTILSTIQRWACDPSSRPILWLYGPAGLGKSTISRTVAQKWDLEGTLAASFFFRRGESDRNNAKKFVTTIAAQMAERIPFLRKHIVSALETNPSLPDKMLDAQYQSLILDTLSAASEGRKSSSSLFIVVDALDECEDKEEISLILQVLNKQPGRGRIRILVTSRPDTPSIQGFDGVGSHDHVDLYKATEWTMRSDIELYFRRKLGGLRKGSKRDSSGSCKSWPDQQSIQILAARAQPLFIVAAILCRFIGDQTEDPERRLRQVLRDSRSFTSDPLDQIYCSVLTQYLNTDFASDRQERIRIFTKVIGTVILLFDPLSVNNLARLLVEDADQVQRRLGSLRSILILADEQQKEAPIRTLHMTLHDFLTSDRIALSSNQLLWSLRIHKETQHGDIATNCIRLLSDSGILRKDICGIGRPDTPRKTVKKTIIESALSRDITYAACYWIEHFCLSDRELADGDIVHNFLTDHLLHWLEALSWLGYLSESVALINRLASVSEKFSSTRILTAFLVDVERFILRNRANVDQAPLQIYASALTFLPSRSTVRTVFEKETPTWIDVYAGLSSGWNAELLKLEGHEGFVSSEYFSHDSKRVVSGSKDRTARVWNAETGDELLRLEGHEDWIRSVCFSRDDKLVASASWDKTVRIWNSHTGQLLRKLDGDERDVSSVSFSYDGVRIAAAVDRMIRVWNTDTGDLLKSIEGHDHRVTSVCFSFDGRIASASCDKTVRIWNSNTGQELLKLEGHEKDVSSVSFSGDGRQVVSTSEDRSVRVWDVERAVELLKFEGHTAWTISAKFSHDGCRVASASDDKTVRIWNMSTRKEELKLYDHSGRVNSVSFSNDGKRIASASRDRTVRIWNIGSDTSQPVLQGHKDRVLSVCFSRQGDRVASASEDMTVRLWNAVTGVEQMRLEGHTESVLSVCFSHDGTRVASVSWDRVACIWDASTGCKQIELVSSKSISASAPRSHLGPQSTSTTRNTWAAISDEEMEDVRLRLERHESVMNCVCISHDGKRIAAASRDRAIRIWDRNTGLEQLKLEGHTASVSSVCFSFDDKQIASASEDNSIRIWEAASGDEQLQLRGHQTAVTCVSFSYDATCVASASGDRTVRLWDTTSGSCRLTLKGHDDHVSSVCWTRDGRRVVSGSWDKTVRVWDAIKGQVQLKIVGHTGRVSAACVAYDSQRVASASWDKTVRVWDLVTGMQLLKLEGHRSVVSSVCFSYDGKHIVSASEDKTVQIWDASTGIGERTMEGHREWVPSACFSRDGLMVASASWDNTVRLWDAKSGIEKLKLEGHEGLTSSICFSADGKRVASTSREHTVDIWNAATGNLELRLEGHDSFVSAICFSPCGERVATASWDDTVRIWDAGSGVERSRLKSVGTVKSICFSHDGKRVAAASEDSTVRLWNVGTGDLLETLLQQSIPAGFATGISGGIPSNSNIIVNDEWVKRGVSERVYLPFEYRHGKSAVCNDRVVIGGRSGAMLFLNIR